MGWKTEARRDLADDPDLGNLQWVVLLISDTGTTTTHQTDLTFMEAAGLLDAVSKGHGLVTRNAEGTTHLKYAYTPGYWDRAELMTQADWDGQQ